MDGRTVGFARGVLLRSVPLLALSLMAAALASLNVNATYLTIVNRPLAGD